MRPQSSSLASSPAASREEAEVLAQPESLIPVYIMGNRYEVPAGLTILRAMEQAGFRITRGCGCRAGFCGACATVYRVGSDPILRFALACQTPIEPDMQLVQISYYPNPAPTYDIHDIADPVKKLHELHPQLTKCLGCNTCTKSCPQGLQVMQFVAAMVRGDLRRAADLSFECIMCGMCASRCPQSIQPQQAALFARRAYVKHYQSKSGRLARRMQEIRSGLYDQRIEELMRADVSTLKDLYDKRDFQVEI